MALPGAARDSTSGESSRTRFHNLWQGAASLLPAHGVDARVVMEMLGHSTIALTMSTCSNVIPELQREAADKMEAVLRSQPRGCHPGCPTIRNARSESRTGVFVLTSAEPRV